MLELRDLRIDLDGFTLSAHLALKRAGITAVLGPSGAGKSTLLGAVAGVLPVASGAILWAGQEITGLAPSDRPVGILFQDGNLFPHLSVTGTLALALDPKGRPGPEGQARIHAVLEQVGLGDLGHRRPGELSGGQQARAALARVLLQGQPLWLLDEPFAALGPALRRDMLGLVARMAGAEGATVVMVSHQPDDSREIADDAVWIDAGVLCGPHPVAELFAAPPAALRSYLGM